jgi:diguanylate cyclase (GGDEF)-like protein/PAS domain S-box-containing protein
MGVTAPRIYVAVGLVLIGAYLRMPPASAEWFYEAFLACAVVAMAIKVRREQPPQRRTWALFLAALVSWLTADLLGLLWPGGAVPFPSVVDAFYLLGYPLMAASIHAAIRLRASGRDALSTIDGLRVATAIAVPVYLLWIQPAIRDAELSTAAQAVSLAYPVMDLMLLAIGVRFVLSAGRWERSTIGFVLGIALVVISDVAYNVQVLAGTYESPSLVDVGWLAAFVLWGSAAIRRSSPALAQPGPRPFGVAVSGRSWILGLIVLVPLAVVTHGYVSSTALDLTPLVIALVITAGLTALRLRILARRSDALWQGLAILSAVAILIVVAAIAVTRTNAAGREQERVANQIEALAEAAREGDALVALTLTIDPTLISQVAPELFVARDRILKTANALDFPEADRLRREQQAWLAAAEHQLMLIRPGTDVKAVREAILKTVPLRKELLNDLRSTQAKYTAAAAANAKRGRIASVGVFGSAILAMWLLMLRFGAVNRRAEAAEERSRSVRESEDRMRALLGASADILTVVDPETRVLAHADQVVRILGFPDTGEALRLDMFLDADQAAATRAALQELAGRPGARTRLEWTVRQPDGSTRDAEVSAVDHTSDPRIGGIVLSVRDITERRRLEAALEHQALHDPLTGLANRSLISDRLTQLFGRTSGASEVHALVMLDLDDFRSVNDSFGHRQGDQLLREVARRLSERADSHDTLARVGGDGFAFLVENVTSEEDALERADLMLEAIDAPILLAEGLEHLLSGSVGIALGDGTGEGTPQEQASLMFRDAELAMYEAKRQEGNSTEVFAPHMHDAVTQRLAMRSEMQLALQRGEFFLQYQPIIELRSRCILGYEALVRWMHPERGLVSPGDFIPLAEQSGLIVELGDWVLNEACRQLVEWQRDWDDERYVAVNVAGQQLERPDHVQRVREALESAGLPPRQLLLEVTESSLIHDTDASAARLEALRGLGVRLAIDDFGTGYSSLNYLHRFAVDVLKVDKSFVDDVEDEERGRALVDAIVTMARRLGLTVVAEGIEHEAQEQLLKAMHCDTGQGFHFARPLPAAQVPGFEVPGAMRRVA